MDLCSEEEFADTILTGFITVFNPAPCPSDLLAIWPLTQTPPDILIVNETEASSLLSQIAPNADATTISSPAKALIRSLPHLRILVVTAGADGAYVVTNSDKGEAALGKVPILDGVTVVDTTGAGDTFVGYFVASLAKRMAELGITELRELGIEDIAKAARLASVAGGLCCEKVGAMPSIPKWDDVLARSAHS